MQINVELDSDANQVYTIRDINKVQDLDEIMRQCQKNMQLPPDFNELEYGFKTKGQQILIAEIGDIVKDKQKDSGKEEFMQDKDFYDNNMKVDTLILRNLKTEAKDSILELQATTKLVKKKAERKDIMISKKSSKDKDALGKMKKISYNLRAELDVFVEEYVACNGVKEIMFLIEECQEADDNDLIYVACQMLAVIFMYGCGIEAISAKPRKYFEKFFELSAINEYIKKQVIRIFLNIANSMSNCFDNIDKAANNYARDSDTNVYQTLIQGLGYNDPNMAIALLKLINSMIDRAEEEKK